MGNELSYQPKTVSINIWFTGSSKIEIGDNAFLYRSEGMLENSFLRIQPSPNPGEHRLNLTGIVQLSNERVYINLGTNGEWKGGNYAASLPAEPNPKANTYLDLGKNGIFISAAKNNQPIAFSGSGTILFKEGEGADYHPYVKFDNYYKSAGFTTNVRFVISNSAPKGRYEPGDFQGIAIKVQQKVNDKDVLPIINLNKVSTLDYVVNLTDENVNLGNNYFFANIEGDPKSTTDSSSIVIHPATPKAINLNTLDATIGFDTVEGKTYKRAYVTYKKSAAPSKEGSAMQSENVQIGSHTLFSQVEFLPNLIKHGEGFWATADYVQTHYDHVKFKGQQVSCLLYTSPSPRD